MSSPNVVWQASEVTRAQRWESLGTRGATVWLTGLPASGKSTISGALEARLIAARRVAYRLDGDNLRHGLCGDLGFSAADRARNVARVGEVALLFADAGAVAVVALVSPQRAGRDEVRRRHAERGLRFVEVFVDTPVQICASRDPKGLYARARAGEIVGFTGVDDPYDPPPHAEVVLPGEVPVSEAVDAIIAALDAGPDPVSVGPAGSPPGATTPGPAASVGEALR